jgi:hypothetical protein
MHKLALDTCRAGATGVTYWSPVIPDFFQAPGYARHMAETLKTDDAPALDVDHVSFRPGVRHHLVIPHYALTGPTEVMDSQINKLVVMSKRPEVTIQVVSEDAVIPVAAFQHFHFPKGVDCVYQPGLSRGVFSSGAAEVSASLNFVYRVLHDAALTPSQSIAYLHRASISSSMRARAA